MNDKLIEQLSLLSLEEKNIKRVLNRYYRDYETRTALFYRLKAVQDEIKQVKFKLRLEKEIRNEKSR